MKYFAKLYSQFVGEEMHTFKHYVFTVPYYIIIRNNTYNNIIYADSLMSCAYVRVANVYAYAHTRTIHTDTHTHNIRL